MFEYKVVRLSNALTFETILNGMALEGWRLKCVADAYLIFEKEKVETKQHANEVEDNYGFEGNTFFDMD